MKDEEMAEEYKADYGIDLCCLCRECEVENINPCQHKKDAMYGYKDGFLAGLKAGRPKLHYLTENPNDLPIGEVFYWFDENPNLKDRKIYGRSIGYYNPYEKEWHGYYKGCPCRVHNVIAWCEIPTFDKE